MFRTETKPTKKNSWDSGFMSWDDGLTRLEIGGGKLCEEVVNVAIRGERRRWGVYIYIIWWEKMGSKNQGPWGDGLKISGVVEREKQREREEEASRKRKKEEEKNMVSKMWLSYLGGDGDGKSHFPPPRLGGETAGFGGLPLVLLWPPHLKQLHFTFYIYSRKRHCLCPLYFFVFFKCELILYENILK